MWFHGVLLAIICGFCHAENGEDRLKAFYNRIAQPDVKYCPDRTKMLPNCDVCIPGLARSAGSTCDTFIPQSKQIRDEIKKLTDERYATPVPDRPFGLYPYLEKPDFMSRQITFGKMISSVAATAATAGTTATTAAVRHIMDIGAYYNPINLFLSTELCPESVMIIEPILDPLSVFIPCLPTPANTGSTPKHTHVLFLPITFKYYMSIASSLPKPETVVCIGCDSHYGPNRKMLETAFEKPYTLYLEYPSEYVHNTPFKKMNGEEPGEALTFIRKFQPKTNETQYTKRVMKVIEYTKI